MSIRAKLELAATVTSFDLDSFSRYCRKYNIPVARQKQILDAFNTHKPKLQRLPTGEWGFEFQVAGKQAVIQMFNYARDKTNTTVTFVGLEGMNL